MADDALDDRLQVVRRGAEPLATAARGCGLAAEAQRGVEEDSFKRFAKAYLKTNGLTFKEKDNVLNGNGVRTTARHAARGIKMGTQL